MFQRREKCYNAFNWPGFIYGTASDSLSDVDVVEITIQRQSDNMYWNGASWQAGVIWLSTTGTLNWQYLFIPTDGETYTVRSRGTDNAGNVETTFGISDFTYTASGPSAPVVSSSTHPSPVSWYNNDDPTLNWTTPSSGVGIQGYSYSLDQTLTTLPDTSIESNNNTVSYNNVTDGVWYFHIRAQDNANNWGPAAHFKINIDTATPSAPTSLTEEQPDIDWDADGDLRPNIAGRRYHNNQARLGPTGR